MAHREPCSFRFFHALRVIARIATIAQDHSGLVAGVSTPHAGAVVSRLSLERLVLGGGSADGTNACRGVRSEPLMQSCYEARLLSPSGLGSQALVHQVVGQLPEALSCLILRL